MIYGVKMEQGVSANLNEHTLITGHGNPEDALLSCSAVMFVNTNDWRGGLYHFPEGSINEKDGEPSRAILMRMIVDLGPLQITQIYIYHGTVTSLFGGMGNVETPPGDEVSIHRIQLKSFLRRRCHFASIEEGAASHGVTWITRVGGRLKIGLQDDGDPITNVGDQPDGAYEAYTVFKATSEA
jgi:hypothetical protein